MSVIIGIDLGTSTTEAAVFQDGQPVMLVNPEGQVITPSVVGLGDSGEWLVGEDARERLLLEPGRTAAEIKRKIGSGEAIRLGGADYTAQALSAQLLGYVKRYAEAALGQTVDRAVISVPAYFDERQRQETLRAGQEAGFQVERILNEPTAAALSYGLQHMAEESHILVYDLGGGTFDVTLLEMFEGVLEVKASAGDNQLGGKDFDQRLIDELIRRFEKKNGVSLRRDAFALAHLKAEAEHCKRVLSREERVTAVIPAIVTRSGKPLALEETITRAEFEALTADLLARTHAPIQRTLSDSGLTADQLDRVILVGGSTRMPMVARDIRAFLGMEVTEAVDPDFAVAQGTAVEAAILTGEIDPGRGLVMTDVNPYSLGVRSVEDGDRNHMSVIIPRNVTIPVTRRSRYRTYSDRQTEAEIEVFQGESEDVRENHPLGSFTLSGIPPRPAGRESLDVYFTYNTNGMLEVRGVIVSTGREARLRISLHGGEEAVAAGELPAAEPAFDEDAWRACPMAREYRAVIRMAERYLKAHPEENSTRSLIAAQLRLLKQAIMDEEERAAVNAETTLRMLLLGVEE